MTTFARPAAVIAAAAAAGVLLSHAKFPGAWLVGPLLVGIATAVTGFLSARVPRGVFHAAQAVVGALIAQAFTPPVVADLARNAGIIALVVATTVLAAGIAGWLLARFGTLNAATAAWGSAPGAAAAMTAMSGGFGADARLVAFMQYLRVTLVVLSAGAVARALLPHAPPALPAPPLAPPGVLAKTLAVTVAGALGARALRVPSGALLGPMILGAVLAGTGVVRLAVPAAALDAAYVGIGLSVGLLYTRETVRYALRAIPELLLATGVLIVLCGGSAALLAATAHVDGLTAYLATTPGGIDSVTVIALASGANAPLVLAVQALRVFVVILSGPPVAKLIARLA